MIFSGQLRYFDFEVQEEIGNILLNQKIMDQLVVILLENKYCVTPKSMSQNFHDYCKETGRLLTEHSQKLLELLNSKP